MARFRLVSLRLAAAYRCSDFGCKIGLFALIDTGAQFKAHKAFQRYLATDITAAFCSNFSMPGFAVNHKCLAGQHNFFIEFAQTAFDHFFR